MRILFIILASFLLTSSVRAQDVPKWDDYWEAWVCPSYIAPSFIDSIESGVPVNIVVRIEEWGKDPRIKPVWIHKNTKGKITIIEEWTVTLKKGYVIFYCYSELYHCITEPQIYKVY